MSEQSDWKKLDEHLHGKKAEDAPAPDQSEWSKLDEHLTGKKTEDNTSTWTVTRHSDHVTLMSSARLPVNLNFAEVYQNDVLLYDTRKFQTGDVIKIVVYEEVE